MRFYIGINEHQKVETVLTSQGSTSKVLKIRIDPEKSNRATGNLPAPIVQLLKTAIKEAGTDWFACTWDDEQRMYMFTLDIEEYPFEVPFYVFPIGSEVDIDSYCDGDPFESEAVHGTTLSVKGISEYVTEHGDVILPVTTNGSVCVKFAMKRGLLVIEYATKAMSDGTNEPRSNIDDLAPSASEDDVFHDALLARLIAVDNVAKLMGPDSLVYHCRYLGKDYEIPYGLEELFLIGGGLENLCFKVDSSAAACAPRVDLPSIQWFQKPYENFTGFQANVNVGKKEDGTYYFCFKKYDIGFEVLPIGRGKVTSCPCFVDAAYSKFETKNGEKLKFWMSKTTRGEYDTLTSHGFVVFPEASVDGAEDKAVEIIRDAGIKSELILNTDSIDIGRGKGYTIVFFDGSLDENKSGEKKPDSTDDKTVKELAQMILDEAEKLSSSLNLNALLVKGNSALAEALLNPEKTILGKFGGTTAWADAEKIIRKHKLEKALKSDFVIGIVTGDKLHVRGIENFGAFASALVVARHVTTVEDIEFCIKNKKSFWFQNSTPELGEKLKELL